MKIVASTGEDKPSCECGVFGIFGHRKPAEMTYFGLYSLQHRGQESAGIAVADGEIVTVRKGMGEIADVFPDRDSLRRTARPCGHRAQSLLDRRIIVASERAAAPDEIQVPPHGRSAQRQHHQRRRTEDGTRADGAIFTSSLGFRIGSPPVRPFAQTRHGLTPGRRPAPL